MFPMPRSWILLALFVGLVALFFLITPSEAANDEAKIKTFFQKGGSHTNNWAVLVRAAFNQLYRWY